jgi:LPXTG-motif cell wall-anchored protein
MWWKGNFMTARRLGAGLILLMTLLVVGPTADAQTTSCPSQPSYAPSRGTATVNTTTVAPGGTVTISGGGFRAGSTVVIHLVPGGTRVGTATAGADCRFTATVTIPTGVLGTQFSLEASGVDPSGNALVVGATINVAGAGGALPTTGSSSTQPLTMAGIGLVLIGAAAVVVVRRRRAQPVLD